MDPWIARGRYILGGVLALLALIYLAERLVYHSVVRTSSLSSSILTAAILAGIGALIWRGFDWLRFVLAGYFILNGLGSPSGMAAVYGAGLSTLIAFALLAAHLAGAAAIAFAPGIRAFARHQRHRKAAPPPAA
ncbi:MAG TPA: hypothetical protein PKA05_16485 [Roseiflexaceae bacterium]|nr:hypothetical protein [Roseiflexaceae bacterium]HMP41978.1 hypothetical protein [Roseiflexaceae bacterium]